MLPEVNRAVAPLRAALDSDNWKGLGSALHKISTTKTKSTSSAVSSETIRVTTDILIEECAFSTAFERAFDVRRALHGVDAGKWLYSALMNVNPASPVARRLVTLVECLSTTEAGRTLLGRNKVVDAIIHIWKRSPSGRGISNLPGALCALCSGHIDNIARLMRIGGVSVILKTLEGECGKLFVSSEESENVGNAVDRKLLNNTLLLLGLICICIPDKPTNISGANRRLVPIIAKIIRSVCEKEETMRTQKSFLAHAINIIANIAECWRKEGSGFEIRDADALLGDITNAWKKAPRNRQVVSSAAWAITGLIRAKKVDLKIDADYESDDSVREELVEILAKSTKSISSVRALHKVLIKPVEEAPAKESTEEEKKPISKKRARDEEAPEEPESMPSKRPRIETVPSTPIRTVTIVNDKDEDFSSPTRLEDMNFDRAPVPSSPSCSSETESEYDSESEYESESEPESEEEELPVAAALTTRRGRKSKVPEKLAGYVA